MPAMNCMSDTIHTTRALYTAAQVRELDKLAIRDGNIEGYELMCRAGTAAWDVARERWPGVQRVAVICGTGNNGGDGFVVARLAALSGCAVSVALTGDEAQLRGDAARAFAAMQSTTVQLAPSVADALHGAELIVDAIFGTGLDRNVAGNEHRAIDAINSAGAPVLALDIPSGLSADRGVPLGVAVVATATATFVGRKRGLFTGLARDYCGAVNYFDLQIPRELVARVVSDTALFGLDEAQHVLAPRRRTAHKGDCGHVLVIGGAPGMSGAVRLAGEAALRAGAGWVSVATHPDHAASVTAARPELMCRGFAQRAELLPLIERATALAVGPGLGRGAWAQLAWAVALESALPLVVDADALNLLAQDGVSRGNWVLTPHPGEAGRLLNCASADIEHDRYAAVRALQQRYGGVVVLKGAGTVVCDGARIDVIDTGNPGMASGGMGDVLTGVIAALVAQGLSLADAARVGAAVHGGAGDRAASDGERGMVASDLFAPLRELVNP